MNPSTFKPIGTNLSKHLLLVSTLLLLTPTPTLAQDCELNRPIKFGGLDWDSDAFHVANAKFILEKGFGCEVEVIPGTTLPLLTALGKGDVDIVMEVWKDNVTEAWNQLESAGKVQDLGVNFPDAIQGIYVPTYLIKGDASRGITAKAPDLKHVNDLVKYKELFLDPEEPNKGRFYNCILGWSCEDVNTKKLSAYGLDRHFTNFRPGTGAALIAAIVSAYQKGEPIVAYYWGPTWLLGKYDLTMLEEPPYDEKIWNQLGKEKRPKQATAYPPVKVFIGANKKFITDAPRTTQFLKSYETSNKLISEALAYMQDKEGRTAEDAAVHFLRTHRELLKAWVPVPIFRKLDLALEHYQKSSQKQWFVEIDEPINKFVNWIVNEYGDSFDAIAQPLRITILTTERLLGTIPWRLFIIILGIFCWLISRNFKLPLIVMSCMFLVGALGLWHLAMQTLALMLVSTMISVIIGLPLGVALSRSNRVRSFSLPILDAIQTMPIFVYLIPAMMLFGLGKVPAVFATVIYAVAPLIRLTDHGIRMVAPELTEAAQTFGASPIKVLINVQLPLAIKTIMAGVNQTTMLALSMVVIASMIGARGLGENVLLGIQKLDVGQGFTAGIAIVALAIVLDRVTQAIGKRLDRIELKAPEA